jgi:hypothetical protein
MIHRFGSFVIIHTSRNALIQVRDPYSVST